MQGITCNSYSEQIHSSRLSVKTWVNRQCTLAATVIQGDPNQASHSGIKKELYFFRLLFFLGSWLSVACADAML